MPCSFLVRNKLHPTTVCRNFHVTYFLVAGLRFLTLCSNVKMFYLLRNKYKCSKQSCTLFIYSIKHSCRVLFCFKTGPQAGVELAIALPQPPKMHHTLLDHFLFLFQALDTESCAYLVNVLPLNCIPSQIFSSFSVSVFPVYFVLWSCSTVKSLIRDSFVADKALRVYIALQRS